MCRYNDFNKLCLVTQVAFVHTQAAVAKNTSVRDWRQCTAFCELKGGEETSRAKRGGGGDWGGFQPAERNNTAVLLLIVSRCVSLSPSNGPLYTTQAGKPERCHRFHQLLLLLPDDVRRDAPDVFYRLAAAAGVTASHRRTYIVDSMSQWIVGRTKRV